MNLKIFIFWEEISIFFIEARYRIPSNILNKNEEFYNMATNAMQTT